MDLIRKKLAVFLTLMGLSVSVSSQTSKNLIEAQPSTYIAPSIVTSVNEKFNKFKYISDPIMFGKEDYWQTYDEFVANEAGDCEDYAIAKYRELKKSGFDKDLYIAYVMYLEKDKSRRTAHMVTVYKDKGEYIIMDSLLNTINRSSERKDLLPIYMFNEKEILVIRNQWSTVEKAKTYHPNMKKRSVKYLLND